MSKFKKCEKNSKKDFPSGSGAVAEEEVWELYGALQFLKPYIQHDHVISSMSSNPIEDLEQKYKENKNKRKPEEPLEDKLLKKMINNSFTSNDNCNEGRAKINKVNKFMPMIKSALKKVLADQKEACVLDILIASEDLLEEFIREKCVKNS